MTFSSSKAVKIDGKSRAPLPRFARFIRRLFKPKSRKALFSSNNASSISDEASYLESCIRAATINGFNSFRADPAYRRIVETVSEKEGAEALEIANTRYPNYPLDAFRRNDEFGGAELFQFGKYGKFAPTTARYVKVLSDLETLFGDLDGLNIIEIGGGYGGQARIINERFKPKSYKIIDLPEACAVTRRYLDSFGSNNIVTSSQISADLTAPDLVISNYALSEIRRSIQTQYIERYVAQSQRGYMLWNNQAFVKGYLKDKDAPMNDAELATIVRGTILRESPFLMHSDELFKNSLIVWGQ